MIRIEDLGEPIQLLLKDMQAKGKVDMDLLEFIRVKDVAKVFEAQSLGKEVCECTVVGQYETWAFLLLILHPRTRLVG